MTAPTEQQRQAELDALELESFEATAFSDLVQLAVDTFDVPMSSISIVDHDRRWFKSGVGVDLNASAPREGAFCDIAMQEPDQVLVVEDARADPRFASYPLVTGEAGFRFYAAAPLTLGSGASIGALCVMDTRPRQVDQAKVELLKFMARQVVAAMEARQRKKADET